MNLVILAAGQGVRLGKIADDKPKSLVPIQNGKPYLFYELDAFAKFDFARRIVIGGFAFDDLKAAVESHSPQKYCIVNNPDYRKGNLYTLLAAKPQLDSGFFVFNADHYYSEITYKKIFGITPDQITVFCDRDRNLTDDDMKVEVNKAGQFVRMAKTLSDCAWGYVGVTFVPTALLPLYWQATTKTALELGDKANVESVINTLAESGHSIRIADISGSWWTEIDTPEDYEKACQIILKNIQ